MINIAKKYFIEYGFFHTSLEVIVKEANITSEGVLDLLNEIKGEVKSLHILSNNDKLNEKIRFFQKNHLKY